MEVMKRIGAGLLGAFEGVVIAILIMAIVFSSSDNKEEEFSINVWWCIVAGKIIIESNYATLSVWEGLKRELNSINIPFEEIL